MHAVALVRSVAATRRRRGTEADVQTGSPSGKFHERVWDVVRRIPRGRVASYKLVGLVAGYPRSARFVGRAMAMAKGTELPWHRVVAQDGRIVIVDPALRARQIERLRAEGVEVSEAGRLDYARHAWRPRGAGAGGSAGARREG